MAPNNLILAAVFLLFHFSSPSSSHVVDFNNYSLVLISTLKSTIGSLMLAQEHLSVFSYTKRSLVGMSNAVSDCVELLDYTRDELNASLSLIENPKGRYYGTGNRIADMKTWLSAAIANQETCIEGFKNVSLSTIPENDFVHSLQQIIYQVSNLLGMIQKIPSKTRHNMKSRLSVTSNCNSVVVAQDGSGNFTNIVDAVASAPDKSMSRCVIYVRKGTYKENVEIQKNKWNLMLVGEGMDLTVISGNLSKEGSNNTINTYRTATFAVIGKGFIAKSITFENTAGPSSHQAVALRSNSDLSVFHKCRFLGYQDTLYVHSNRQFYKECQISGTIDFIFGKGSAVFQNCSILVRNGSLGSYNTITAHSSKSPNVAVGFSIQFGTVSSDSNVLKPTYLGRPWKEYARTVFMQTFLSDVINPEGWIPWGRPNESLDKLYYGEYSNTGPGSGLDGRVTWPGYHIMDSVQANSFTVGVLLGGDGWLPDTGIAYTSGLQA